MLETLAQNALQNLPGRTAIAVSGGLDSVVLLHLVRRALPDDRLLVAHFNHHTRGEESDGDAAFVRALAGPLDYYEGHYSGQGDSEVALREARLHFLEGLAADHILTGHHLDDQIETFLIRLLRGAGIDGLSAMAPVRGKFVRPLLTVPRSVLETYARVHALKFRTDASNAEPRYLRNRIRQRIMPLLDEIAAPFGGPQWRERVGGSLEEIREAKSELAALADARYTALATRTPFWIRMSQEKFRALGVPQRHRLLRRTLSALGAEPPSRFRLADADAALRRSQGKLCLPSGVTIVVSCGYLFFQGASERAALNTPFSLESHADGSIVCPPLGLSIAVDPAWDDTFEWRFPRPGDRLGKTKLKHLLLEARIPLPERRLLPVLARIDSPELHFCLPFTHREIKLNKVSFPFSFLAR